MLSVLCLCAAVVPAVAVVVVAHLAVVAVVVSAVAPFAVCIRAAVVVVVMCTSGLSLWLVEGKRQKQLTLLLTYGVSLAVRLSERKIERKE